jgi:lipopolysaccharide/colanic/teichoic acid biosynthesis glycosyltransferase
LLIIVGNKYKFTKQDLEILKKKFKNYEFYSNFDKIKNINKNILIVNNFEKNIKNNLNTISIEDFLERYLYKVYIPEKGCYKIDIKPLSKKVVFFKRLEDYIISFFIIIFSFPLVLFSIYKIKKESPEDGFIFKQIRIGKNNKKFICYKLRSMKPHIVNEKNLYHQENDKRVFKWGRFMRDTRIDELLQLINVIKGDMHLIGPRAEWDILVDKYSKIWGECYNKRHLISPGLTGWAQVNYPYGKNLKDTRQKLMYDLYYIKNWSLKLEFLIIFKTAKMVLKSFLKKVKK